MSTRANIEIQDGRTNLVLYRHLDGYPAMTGLHLIQTLRSASTKECFVTSLLSHHTNGRKTYAITDGIHGDIDYKYVIEYMDSIKPWFTVYERDRKILDTTSMLEVETYCLEQQKRLRERWAEMKKERSPA